MIIAADISAASAAKTRTCPTRRSSCGVIRAPPRKPRKYPDMTTPMVRLPKPSIPPRTPSSVPCRPLPIMIRNMPSSSAQVLVRTASIGPPDPFAQPCRRLSRQPLCRSRRIASLAGVSCRAWRMRRMFAHRPGPPPPPPAYPERRAGRRASMRRARDGPLLLPATALVRGSPAPRAGLSRRARCRTGSGAGPAPRASARRAARRGPA